MVQTMEAVRASAVSDETVTAYYNHLAKSLCRVEVRDVAGQALTQGEAITRIIGWARATHADGRKLMFIGNGGSAGICSHMATDYSKNGNMRALAFNDGSMLTCWATIWATRMSLPSNWTCTPRRAIC